ncbi:hypothetical protein DFS34DRAFT_406158 [Phlyctochytrium arcticum]|nr:hypothetical protein DFS34DRAFT_406158 [Phlyctochytrium arcticum]
MAVLSEMSSDERPVLSPYEVQPLVEKLTGFGLQDVGGKQWMKQHDVIERLNIQAHQNTQMMVEEFVTEELITAEKIPMLIHDLILVYLWKRHVYPDVKSKLGQSQKAALKLYFVLYHEATILNLLEIVLYNALACESGGDALIDLADYCAMRLAALGSWEDEQNSDSGEAVGASSTLSLTIHLSSISIIRHLTTHISSLPHAVLTRILTKHDIPSALVWVLEKRCWERRRRIPANAQGRKGWIVERLIEGRGGWSEIEGDEVDRVGGWEAQAWLTLCNIFFNEDCRKCYNFSTVNHSNVLKLRAHITETLIDQLPPLGALLRFLEELSLYTPVEPGMLQMSYIEVVPEIEQSIMNGVAAQDVAEKFVHELGDGNDTDDFMKELADVYTHPALTSLLPDTPRCAEPSCPNREVQQATQRCSRCKSEWYCSRPCQVKNWKNHKDICQMLAAAREQ